MEKLYYSHESFAQDVRNFAQKLKQDGVTPDCIVGIARGGLFFATALAFGLPCRRVLSIQASSYEESAYEAAAQQDHLEIFDTLNLEGMNTILLVDDVADSGQTFKRILAALREGAPKTRFLSASLFLKPVSDFRPDYFLHETSAWIVFFHEVDYLPKVSD